MECWPGQAIYYKLVLATKAAKDTALRSKIYNLFGSESEQCVPVERHVYLCTDVSVSCHYDDLAKLTLSSQRI